MQTFSDLYPALAYTSRPLVYLGFPYCPTAAGSFLLTNACGVINKNWGNQIICPRRLTAARAFFSEQARFVCASLFVYFWNMFCYSTRQASVSSYGSPPSNGECRQDEGNHISPIIWRGPSGCTWRMSWISIMIRACTKAEKNCSTCIFPRSPHQLFMFVLVLECCVKFSCSCLGSSGPTPFL